VEEESNHFTKGAVRVSLSKPNPLKIIILAVVVVGLAIFAIARLTRGPSTKDEVCASFDSLGDKVRNANGFIDNPVFRQASDLSDLAGRYEGQPDLTADAEALEKIGDSNATSTVQLTNATRRIASLCGHPLGLNTRNTR
jgi:hypothetical protein